MPVVVSQAPAKRRDKSTSLSPPSGTDSNESFDDAGWQRCDVTNLGIPAIFAEISYYAVRD